MNVKKQIVLILMVLALAIPSFAIFAQDSTPAASGEGEQSTTTTEGEGEHSETEGEHSETAAATEAAPNTNPLVPLGINVGFLIGQIINFGVVMFLLTVLLWNPLTKIIDSRAEEIAKGLEDAKAAAAARANAEVEAQKVLNVARSEAQQLIEQARARGDEVSKGITAEAQQAAAKIKSDAQEATVTQRNAELAGLRGQVAAISMAAAQRLIGEALDEKKQKALVDDFFTKLPAAAKNFSGDVEVVSAMPLNEAEQGKVKSQLGASDVTFTVDTSILGGLIVRSGDRVVDGSIRSGLNELSNRLN
jgi:F-type H+-transporting ATPase subunit b